MQRDLGGNFYLELSGDSHLEIGRQHGEILKSPIAESLANFKAWLGSRISESPDELIERLVTQSNYLASWEQYAPHLLAELRGIADGSQQPFNQIFAFNLLEEVLDVVIKKGPGAAHCTTFSVVNRKSRDNILAENMDWANYYNGAQAVIRIRYPQSDLELLMYGFAGTVSGIGVNNQGLGVAVNTVLNTKSRSWSEGGLTCMATQRLILEHDELDSAAQFLQSVPHSYGMNYMIANASGALSVEVSRNDVAVIEPTIARPYLAHSNHALKSHDLASVNNYFQGREAVTSPSVAHTVERLECTVDAIEANADAFDSSSAAALLGTAPVKANADPDLGIQTLQSMIIEFGESRAARFMNPDYSDTYQAYQY
ncbi:hypothetical protein HBA55_04225 [Pseudomaricurvus alkylphenolicus]|uniref:C45 family autoproteolytic acyltransferase/hydolase n=1 Tax=Pseudomaricurvus alkylphenolicus TaxID=1306991 RepID=UPI00141F39B8|nr:C45 family peptidase [Pseudomaricurvus alkylphenolicus]NIB38777.1 hypothetical protein [Pseudomaricurvus alkylphenolicus]